MNFAGHGFSRAETSTRPAPTCGLIIPSLSSLFGYCFHGDCDCRFQHPTVESLGEKCVSLLLDLYESHGGVLSNRPSIRIGPARLIEVTSQD